MVRLIRKCLPFLAVALFGAAAYDGWFFYSRWRNVREVERRRQSKEAEEARRTFEMLGGGRLKILNFYASPGAIRRGEHANICYGVYGARSVRIEPLVEVLQPAVAHCVQVAPSKSTEYKLVADDSLGNTATERLVIQVAP